MNEAFLPVFSLLLGIGMSFVGTLPPGVISLTVMDTAARKSLRDGLLVAGAAALVEFFQAAIAVSFSSAITRSEWITRFIQYSAIPVFLLLGLYILQKKESPQIQHTHTGTGTTSSSIVKGLIVSITNLLVIPFWIFWSAYFASNGWIEYKITSVLVFSSGITIGTFLALALYAKLGLTIGNKSAVMAFWARKIIGTTFLVFAGYHLVKMLSAQ